ncbi:N-acetyltransferase [Bradyrhizobium sp. CER78]|uniref:GNAT family N-acetyltransferase n=1 Tax=Bradyrhizobium sp. CER78 TaxID=3039162 RepID=UPI00244CCFFD|nr:N-acetyltransferase [Bradyrhizobium sp. CER78]MDH2384922.1 N-acetyltransferase [Bradyrhizobium sp. CER78]
MSLSGSPNDRPVAIRRERRSDVAARESLLDDAFGSGRFAKTSERLREGRKPARGLAFVARRGGCLIGTLRLWPVVTGTGHDCLLLGPLAVAEEARCLGIGAALMRQALQRANLLGHRAVILVGDAAYYDRFGFSAERTAALRMPGPYDRQRLLGCELVPGALSGAGGLIVPASPRPSRLSGLMDRIAGSQAPIGQPA